MKGRRGKGVGGMRECRWWAAEEVKGKYGESWQLGKGDGINASQVSLNWGALMGVSWKSKLWLACLKWAVEAVTQGEAEVSGGQDAWWESGQGTPGQCSWKSPSIYNWGMLAKGTESGASLFNVRKVTVWGSDYCSKGPACVRADDSNPGKGASVGRKEDWRHGGARRATAEVSSGPGHRGMGQKTRRVNSICRETLVRTRRWRTCSSLGIERTLLMTNPGFWAQRGRGCQHWGGLAAWRWCLPARIPGLWWPALNRGEGHDGMGLAGSEGWEYACVGREDSSVQRSLANFNCIQQILRKK